jgi:hypothetical protein
MVEKVHLMMKMLNLYQEDLIVVVFGIQETVFA